jgi:Tol biopolymer transport system component
MGWYPPRASKLLLLLGWVPFLLAGVVVARLEPARRRRLAAATVATLALVVPFAVMTWVAGFRQPTQYPVPGGDWFAVTAAPDGTYDLYLWKGRADRLIAYGETPWIEGRSALSPDRRHIAFTSDRYGSADLFVMDLAADGTSTGIRRLTTEPAGDEVDPSWSPDGSRIVFAAQRDGWSRLVVIGADGSGARLLTAGTWNASPAWSPDGERIAFVAPSGTPSNDDIWVVGADGSDPHILLDATLRDSGPVWAPDGTRIAFAGGRPGAYDVYVGEVASATATDLMPDTPSQDAPIGWTRDGSTIVFVSNRERAGGFFSYGMDPDGGEPAAAPSDLRNPARRDDGHTVRRCPGPPPRLGAIGFPVP